VRAPHALPGIARATVDGFAVRAADTYGVSEGQPGYLDLAGEARMGRPPETALRRGAAIAIATGAPLPPGADAVVKVEHTQSTLPGLIEVVRPATPGEGMVRMDEDAEAGAGLARPGRPLRAADLGMLAAAGVAEVLVHGRPRVSIVSTGDELVPRDTPALQTGQVRDASAPALAALVREAGGEPSFAGIVPDDREALEAALRLALGSSDLLVVSAGSSVGARDETASAIASLGEPGIWCHGLALRPGKPTLLAECGGVPVIGLPGNPRSALVVFRLVGMPLVRLVGGCTDPPPEPSVPARLARDLAAAAGRLDVVQVSLDEHVATPLFGSSALLSILARADGYVVVPEAATGLPAGAEVEVTLYR
jgi:molybdopterin molybdotransferase